MLIFLLCITLMLTHPMASSHEENAEIVSVNEEYFSR